MNIKVKIFKFDVWKAKAFDEFLKMGIFLSNGFLVQRNNNIRR